MMYTLLTGATGLVGRYLVRDLLLNGHKLAVVVRPSRRETPRDRMEEVLQHWERELRSSLPRPVVLSGDIAEPGLGLTAEDREWVGRNCSSIIHNAAILEFHGKDRAGEPWRTNLNGTQNTIDLCRELKIRDIHYVSTAYVAGYQTGRVMEESLDAGQTFRNDYEESKFCAEKLVREIDFADHVTIYRPAVISGDSTTGYTNTYHGIYLYLRLLSVMIPPIPPDADGVRHTPVRVQMTGDERRNIVPVEWVSAVICRLFDTPAARGLTFHMAPDNPFTSRAMIEYCQEYFNAKGVILAGHDVPEPLLSREGNEDQWLFERLLMENAETYAPYDRTDNTFDMTNTKRFAGDIVCPELDRTVLFRYIQYGTEDRWGKRRPEVEPVSSWALDFFTQLQSSSSADSSCRTIGLDLLGPGGAQLTLDLSRSGIHRVQRGLPHEGTPILSFSADAIGSLVRHEAGTGIVRDSWDVGDPALAQELTDLFLSCLQSEAITSQT